VHITKALRAGSDTRRQQGTFTGEVWFDSILPTTDGTTVNNVFFCPGGRTFWHSHERGQLLYVISGAGYVCSAGGPASRIEVGDVIWVPPGERHWHGAGPASSVLHIAISLGQTTWLDEVGDAEFATATA
jgi:quercetin dioxygenase-like cupin family protein